MTFLPVLPGYVLAGAGVVVVLLRAATLYRVLVRTAPGSYRRVVLRWAGLTCALLLLVLAAYRPGFSSEDSRSTNATPAYVSDLNVILVVDRSLTSRVADWGDQQARMVGMREDITALMDEYRGARFTMIGFATKATVDWPISQDDWGFRAYVKNLAAYSLVPYDALDFIDPTAAGKTLAEQLSEAKKLYPDSKNVVFYMGDGNVGPQATSTPFELPTDQIAGGAVLGYGTQAGGTIPASVANGQKLYYAQPGSSTFLTSAIDENRLRSIAESLGVKYFHREAGQDLTPVLPPVSSSFMADTTLPPDEATSRVELYWVFAVLASVLLFVEVVLTVREYRRNRMSRSDVTVDLGVTR
ncbi:VWA domain-containing protein [Mycolicibacterium sp. 018/SC-01/001]|uniref:VWA domain-containing protein n=1 Tax=Mycolicibacterium sp. 018/SC-01/001 TaxID=2592069 RepID=UPI00117D9B07|nr:VWA domain-containing protein [Mycolicibacterium sp. 018/SC-01/001]TRW78230.1 VWA domain-containing protein [Mycolicibacterium sp. 018/SC-01/001]